MALKQQNRNKQWSGKIELDEIYFERPHMEKRGQGAAGNIAVFGLLRREEQVYTVITPEPKRYIDADHTRKSTTKKSIVDTTFWYGYNALDVSEFKHFRLNHSKLFADRSNHINGIENFWNQAKQHMKKFNAIPNNIWVCSLSNASSNFM